MVRDLQHITADSPGRRPQLLFPGSIAGKKDTVRTGNQPDNPRVLILPSFLIFCGCFYNLYYTLFFAYFLVCLHFVYNFSVLSKLFQRYQFCYCFGGKSISSCQIGGREGQCGDGEPVRKACCSPGMIQMPVTKNQKIHFISSQPPEKRNQDPFSRIILSRQSPCIHHDDFPFRRNSHSTVPLPYIQKIYRKWLGLEPGQSQYSHQSQRSSGYGSCSQTGPEWLEPPYFQYRQNQQNIQWPQPPGYLTRNQLGTRQSGQAVPHPKSRSQQLRNAGQDRPCGNNQSHTSQDRANSTSCKTQRQQGDQK